MLYSEVINLEEDEQDTSVFTQQDRIFIKKSYPWDLEFPFTGFRFGLMPDEERQAIKTNWKARVSVHPDDLDAAWDICAPYLFSRCNSFKVANRNKISKIRETYIEKNKRLFEIKAYLNKGEENTDITQLREESHWLFRELVPEPYSGVFAHISYYFMQCMHSLILYFMPQSYVYLYVETQYEALTRKQEKTHVGLHRFTDGMQFTIYMCPGSESAHWDMLKDIEHQLILNEIRPGRIYRTDRVLGRYVSIRHPGIEYYHDAYSVESYNPDNVHDPFEPIPEEVREPVSSYHCNT